MYLSYRLALLLSFASGLLSLAYELLWARLYSFLSGTSAAAFGSMLATYLLGLALGSLLNRPFQDLCGNPSTARRLLSRFLLLGYLTAFLLAPLVARSVVLVHWTWTLPAVLLGAAIMGNTLPFLCHCSIPPDTEAGNRTARLYLANILGAVSGSLGTGFLLMDLLPFHGVSASLLVLALLLAVLLLLRQNPSRIDFSLWGLTLVVLALGPTLHDQLYERLMLKGKFTQATRFTDVIETRQGVITVDEKHNVFGGGMYDGRIVTDPLAGGELMRPLFLSAVHPCPKRVLVVGMSAGAWTQLLAHHPQVESVTVIEINPGYLELIRRYPAVNSLLTNPKVSIHIDDGRRWLRRHPGERYDAILMNTTYHFREFASALLGEEFLTLTKAHLAPGGVVIWNTTDSRRATATGIMVFPYTGMIHNHGIASNAPIKANLERWKRILLAYEIDGRPLFDRSKAPEENGVNWMIARALGPYDDKRPMFVMNEQMAPFYLPSLPINDNNLGHEYATLLASHPELLFFLRRTLNDLPPPPPNNPAW